MAAAVTPNREPIHVGILRFVDDRQEVPGMMMSSACTSALVKEHGKHLIRFLPWLRCFEIRQMEQRGGGGDVVNSVMIPESRVMSWTLIQEPKKR